MSMVLALSEVNAQLIGALVTAAGVIAALWIALRADVVRARKRAPSLSVEVVRDDSSVGLRVSPHDGGLRSYWWSGQTAALWWTGDADGAVAWRGRAYARYRKQGDAQRAARLALSLSRGYSTVWGQRSRAKRLAAPNPAGCVPGCRSQNPKVAGSRIPPPTRNRADVALSRGRVGAASVAPRDESR